MAVTKEFKIVISVDDQASGDLKRLEGKTVKVSEISSDLGTNLQRVEKDLQAVGQQTKLLNAAYGSMAANGQAYNQALASQSKTIAALDASTGKYTKTLEGNSGALGTAAKVVAGSIDTFRNLLGIIRLISDPENLKNLARMLQILSLIMRVRGQKQFANQLHNAAIGVEFLSDKLMELGKINQTVFGVIADGAKKVNFALRALDLSVMALEAGLLGLVGVKIASYFSPTLAANINRIGAATVRTGKDMFLFGKTIKNTTTPGILGIAEKGRSIASLLLTMGAAAREADSTFLKFSGTIAFIAGILLGSFSIAITFALKKIGNFIEAIGDKLIGAMFAFEEKANKFEQAVFNMRLSIEGITKELGQKAVGAMDFWVKAVEKADETTSFATANIVKGANLLINEFIAIGLKPVQALKVFQDSLDIAASRGKEFLPVLTSMVKGLAGTTEAAFNLGINLREGALAHSKFAAATHKTAEMMTEEEKVLARLSIVHEMANRVRGAAIRQVETLSGAQALLTKRLDTLQRRLGESGVVTRKLVNIQATLVDTFLDLPKGITRVVGALQDFMGVILKIGGVLLAYTITISGIAFAYRLLSTALAENITLQFALTKAMAFSGKAIGLQTAQVNALTISWGSLGTILSGTILATLRSIGSIFVGFGKAVLSALVVATPFILKFAVIAAVVASVVAAIIELREELFPFEKQVEKTTKTVGFLEKAMSKIENIIVRVKNAMVALSKFLVTGLIRVGLLAAYVFVQLKGALFETEKQAESKLKTLAKLEDMLNKTADVAEKAGIEFAAAFEGVAIARGVEEIEEYEAAISALALRSKELQEFKRSIDLSAEATKILGDQFDRLRLRIRESKKAQEEASKAFLKGGKNAKEALDDLKSALIAERRAHLELKKIRTDTFKDFETQIKVLRVEQLRDQGQIAEAAKLEAADRIAAFDEQAKRLREIYKLRKDEIELIDRLRSGLEAAGQAEISRAQAQEEKRARKALRGRTVLFSKEQVALIKDKMGETAGSIAASASDLSSGALGFVSAANMVLDAAKMLVDIIPNLFDKAADVINSVTNMPLKLAESFDKWAKAYVNFVANFIPNMLRMVPAMLNTIIEEFLINLPDAFLRMMTELPDILVDEVIARLPEIAEKFVTALVAAAPKIAQAIGNFLAGMVGKIFGIDLFESLDITSEIDKTMKKVTDRIERSASQIFKVIDLAAEARGLDIADRIGRAIERLLDAFRKLIELLKSILNFAWNALKKAWEWIKENILRPFLDALKEAWVWIYENIIDPIITVVQKAWQWVVDNVLNKLAGVVSKAWQWVVDNVLNKLAGVVSKAWQWVVDNVLNKLAGVVSKAWGWVKENILDKLAGVVSKAWGWVTENIITPLQTGFSWVSDLVSATNKLFGTPDWLGKFQDMINTLFEWDWPSLPSLGGGTVQGTIDLLGFHEGGPIRSVHRNRGLASAFKLAGATAYQAGGPIEDVPIIAQTGEFVVSRRGVAAAGMNFLSNINRGVTPGTGEGVVIQKIEINARTQLTPDQIRQEVIPAIERSIKRKSQEGRHVIDSRGVR